MKTRINLQLRHYVSMISSLPTRKCSARHAEVQRGRIKLRERMDQNSMWTLDKAGYSRSKPADRTRSCRSSEAMSSFSRRAVQASSYNSLLSNQSGKYKVSNHSCWRTDRFELCAAAVEPGHLVRVHLTYHGSESGQSLGLGTRFHFPRFEFWGELLSVCQA